MLFMTMTDDPERDWNRYVRACEQNYESENNSVHCAICNRCIGRKTRYILDGDEYCPSCARKAVRTFMPEIYLSVPDVNECTDPEEKEGIIEDIIDDFLFENRIN